MDQSLHEIIVGPEQGTKCSAFCGTQGFIVIFTKASHWTISWDK